MAPSTLFSAVLGLSTLLSAVVAAPTTLPSALLQRDTCTSANIQTRMDWDDMSPDDRIAYTDAVKCIMATPSNLDPALYPGATNKFEDYAAVHINRSLNIHVDGYFLTWHRLFLHIWYMDLQDNCGYTGPMPYWNWPATAGNMKDSDVFDGSATSMSGDGVFVDTGPIVLGPNFSLPHGTGGGCVETGPFANYTTTFAPISIGVALSGGPLPPTAFDYSPACLTRDLNPYVAQTWTTQEAVDAAIAAPDIDTFQALINGNVTAGNLGLHLGAHFSVGGMTANLFSSPQDPIWYLLHAYMDKVYTEWQDAHPDVADTVSGTMTFANVPPSAPVTPDSLEPDWDYFWPSVPISELLNTQGGPFCYQYV